MSAIGLVLRERYEIIAELGKGGMSTVFLAKDKILDSFWAVKQVKNNLNIDIDAFKKEVALLSSLSHSDIPRIIDRIEKGDDFFVIMDFIDGTSLGKKVLLEGAQSEQDVVEWAKMLCEVLDYLHTVRDNPIIYRDMKPDNVMLIKSGRVKLIDFGIAKECRRGHKQTGASIGTKGYAAPEQYKGASNVLDERTDIYSLGATLFYLITGLVPDKPPKAIRPIRQINPALSEGLEYIISKCTQDDPNDRYQNCRELLEDLNNIQQLTSSFRRKMSRKLFSFAAVFTACMLGLAMLLVGQAGIQKENEDNYQHYYKQAVSASRGGDYAAAAQHYAKAIDYKIDSVDTYLLYFNALLPQDSNENERQQTKEAIDIMRNGFLDNQQSTMYQNAQLMYQVVKKCVEVSDAVYAAYAVDYIEILKAQAFPAEDLDCFEIIASNCSRNLATQDFEAFNKALIDLEATTDHMTMQVDDALENYYTIMIMYSEYPTYLENAPVRIHEVGLKAKSLIEANLSVDSLTFNSMIPMYELVASNLYNNALTIRDIDEREDQLLRCLEWFGYLDDLNTDLAEMMWLKKAGANKSIFDIHNTPNRQGALGSTTMAYLDRSIDEYNALMQVYPASFLGQVHLTRAYVDKEMAKTDEAQRDFSVVKTCYARLEQMKNSDRNQSSIALSQFSSLKQAIANAGLEE